MPANETDRVDKLVHDVGALTGVVTQVREGVDQLRDALSVLVRHEVRMDSNAAELATLRSEQAAQAKRVHDIEVQMPQLIETRALVVRAAVAVVAMVGVAVVALVVHR